MHVCFIEDTDLRGGTQIWVSEAIRHFLAQGVEVTLLTSESGWNAKDGKETDARVITYNYDEVVQQGPEAQRIWTEALEPADVAVCTVHPPRDGFHCSVFAAQCIARAGLDTVLLPKTGTIVPSYERRFYIPEEAINYHVIAIAKFTRDYLIDEYGVSSNQVSLVYQGTEVDRYTRDETRLDEARQRYSLPAGSAPVLGCVGSFEERKGQVVLLEAIELIRQELPQVHLLLLGDGPDEEMLKQQVVDRGLEENVTFFPFTSEPEYAFEVLDALVLSSLSKEGLPNVVLESMSMEVPVVSSRLAGTPEAVIDGETGYLVPPGDAKALADAVLRLWSDQEAYARIQASGRNLMATQFDKKIQFQAFLDRFQQIAGER
ncbi:MAG: glycosyltransferase family 4 protein [Deltaproteobacteria bacterium]|nr:glycosyltransferase family 4 protein [Deltaproteobacteria bacterium]